MIYHLCILKHYDFFVILTKKKVKVFRTVCLIYYMNFRPMAYITPHENVLVMLHSFKNDVFSIKKIVPVEFYAQTKKDCVLQFSQHQM